MNSPSKDLRRGKSEPILITGEEHSGKTSQRQDSEVGRGTPDVSAARWTLAGVTSEGRAGDKKQWGGGSRRVLWTLARALAATQ